MTTLSTSAFYERATRNIGSLRGRAESLQTALGTGQKLARSSDDPVAAARLRSLTRADAMAAIDTTNAARAASDLTLTDSALSSFADHVIRAQELATQAASGLLTGDQRKGIATELAQLGQEIVRLANARDSVGHALFGGETAGAAYTFDAAGNPLYAGTATAGEMPLGDGQSVTRGLTGPEFLSFTGSSGATDLFAVIGAEYVLRMLPRGTHDYGKFITPAELAQFVRQAGLQVDGLKGLTYNPLTKIYSLNNDTDVNYMVACRKPA